MKKQLGAMGIIVSFIAVGLSGCFEAPKDYITVVCTAQITSNLYEKNNTWISEAPVGLPLQVDFIKDGGERFTLTCAVDAGGLADTESVSFKLYKEQPIEAILTVQGGYKSFNPNISYQSQLLTWDQVKAASDFGKTYAWTPHFYVTLTNGSEW